MDHWSRHAQGWARVGPPLRPCAEDVRVVEAAIAAWAGGRGGRAGAPADVLVLGVTPELVALAAPPASSIVAVDREPAMIDALFEPAPGRRAVVGDWRALPLPAAAIDIAVGDGGLSALAYPADYATIVAELARVVRPGGRVVLRLFATPEVPETLADVRAALDALAIRSFDALKWRLAMAIHRAVAVTAIRDAFDAMVPARAALAARTGWRRDVIDHIDVYRDSPAIYSFPTLAEVRAVFAPRFDELACHVPGYELGERCPTLVWQRRD